jgi:hypothetical protein
MTAVSLFRVELDKMANPAEINPTTAIPMTIILWVDVMALIMFIMDPSSLGATHFASASHLLKTVGWLVVVIVSHGCLPSYDFCRIGEEKKRAGNNGQAL